MRMKGRLLSSTDCGLYGAVLLRRPLLHLHSIQAPPIARILRRIEPSTTIAIIAPLRSPAFPPPAAADRLAVVGATVDTEAPDASEADVTVLGTMKLELLLEVVTAGVELNVLSEPSGADNDEEVPDELPCNNVVGLVEGEDGIEEERERVAEEERLVVVDTSDEGTTEFAEHRSVYSESHTRRGIIAYMSYAD